MGATFRATLDSNLKQRAKEKARGDAEVRKDFAPDPTELTQLPSFSEDGFDVNATSLPDAKPKILGKLFQGLSFTVDKIDRSVQATREVVLFANNKTTLTGFKKRFASALRGDTKRMNRHEFAELMIGSETYDKLERTPFIPGWFKAVATPEQALIGGKRRPKVSMADMFSVGLDFAVDPFTLLSLTPVGAGAKITGVMAKAGVKFPFNPITKGLSKFAGPRSNSPLSFANFTRQPEDVLQKEVFQEIASGKFLFETNTAVVLKKVQDVFGKIKYRGAEDQKLAAALHGLKVGADGLLRPGTTKLTGKTKEVFDELGPIINEHMEELIKMGAIKKSDLVGGTPFAHIFPKLVGRHSIPTDIWQSFDASKIGVMNLAIRKKGTNTGPIKFDNVSGIDSIRDFLYGARRKVDLEPSLTKFAPKGPKPGVVKTPALLASLKAAEHPLTQNMSRFERRYLTDVINEFTGNAKGRKFIDYDNLVGEFFQKLENTPVGSRIAKLYHKLGNGVTADGLADFSTTSKLSGMWSHNIIRAALGGNLSSAVQNLTQTLNFAVAKGMPATIKGMIKFSDPTLRKLRKEINLQRDFQTIWKDDMWVSKLGERYDKVIFSAFNAAENTIRGTGFHVGIGEYLKKNGLKNVKEAIAKGHKEKMMKFAHFESINGAFIYGTLGRAPMLSNPLIRPATTLLSYPFKQGEFLRRTFVNDGSAMLRFIGLHGMLIEKGNSELGIAAEDFLGWGFTPMTRSFGGIPLVASPSVSVALDIAEGLSAYGDDDMALAEQKFKKVVRDLPIALGAVGLPYLGIKDAAELHKHLTTKRQEIGEDGFESITTQEAITNFLISRSTTQKLRSDLKKRQRKAGKKVDFIENKRAKAFVDALFDSDGDRIGDTAWAAAQGIEIEGKLHYTDPSGFQSRVNTLLEKRLIPDDLRSLSESGFIPRVYMLAQLELFERSSTGK